MTLRANIRLEHLSVCKTPERFTSTDLRKFRRACEREAIIGDGRNCHRPEGNGAKKPCGKFVPPIRFLSHLTILSILRISKLQNNRRNFWFDSRRPPPHLTLLQ
jgi:hypothetical protein